MRSFTLALRNFCAPAQHSEITLARAQSSTLIMLFIGSLRRPYFAFDFRLVEFICSSYQVDSDHMLPK